MHDLRDMINVVLRNEGGFTDHEADRGGVTNYGITALSWEEFCAANMRAFTVLDIPHLDMDRDVIPFYAWWYNRPGLRLTTWNNPAMCLMVFDTSVLFGPPRAMRFAQDTLNAQGWRLNVDGVNGPRTAYAANNVVNRFQFVTAYHAAREASHRRTVARDHTQSVFLKGWLNRNDRVRDICLNWLIEVDAPSSSSSSSSHVAPVTAPEAVEQKPGHGK